VGYFMIGWDQFSIWEAPGYSQALVFLPDQDGIRSVLQEAIDFISTPIPFTNQVQTLEAQLTAAHQATATEISQATPIPTLTPMPSATSTGTYNEITPLPTATITPPGYP
jgi:polyisoprenyl-teichoic acid--peptidoglycan teichoic acid transferase